MIKITLNPDGDTRTAKGLPSIWEVTDASADHIDDVRNVLYMFIRMLKIRALAHDHDKISYKEQFYEDFSNTIEKGSKFEDGRWWKRHKNERHHAFETLEDVNLIDILEYAVDASCANIARKGKPLSVKLPSDDCLKKAFNNTVRLIYQNVELVDKDGAPVFNIYRGKVK